MKIVMSSGHGKYIRGASGSPVPPELDEVDEARKVVEAVADYWRDSGVEVITFHDDTSHDQSTNLSTIVNAHNRETRDLDVSVHFNAYDGSAHGVEVLYLTQSSLASKVSSAIAAAGSFTNRGAKYRGDLYFLNNTEEPAILLEVCFCDNGGDSNNYRSKFEAICEAIAESISGVQVPSEPPVEELPPVEPEEDSVNITSTVTGDVQIIFNGSPVSGSSRCRNTLAVNMVARGNMVVTINGQEFHNWPRPGQPPTDLPPQQPPEQETAIPANQKDITATVFGGAADNEYSAYPPYDSSGRGPYLNDTDLYVSLPVNIPDAETRERGVRVFKGELSAVGKIMDKGPWVVNDENYVFGDARPIAETCYKNKTPLPSGSGNNAGKVPSNDAGIDLSPALADKIGIDGKGKVDWIFVDEEVA
jgi:N-acetylmuramoyl-L-alanine amidase